MTISILPDEYGYLYEAADTRWITSSPDWIAALDSMVGQVHYIVVNDPLDGPLAGVSATDDGQFLVVGANDPSGILFNPNLTPPGVYRTAKYIGEELLRLARTKKLKGVLIKQSATTTRGPRRLDSSIVFAFDDLGFNQVSRSFYALINKGATSFDGLSARVATQIRSARRVFGSTPASSVSDWEVIVDLYSNHASARGRRCPFTPGNIVGLTRQSETKENEVLAGRYYYRLENPAKPIGFSISCLGGSAAEVYTWGSLDWEATSQHLTKFIVYDTVSDLFTQGFEFVEYGCRFDSAEFAGLTEFYRRLGGVEVPAHWLYKELAP